MANKDKRSSWTATPAGIDSVGEIERKQLAARLSRDFEGYLLVNTIVTDYQLEEQRYDDEARSYMVPARAYRDAYSSFCADRVANNTDMFDGTFRLAYTIGNEKLVKAVSLRGDK